MDIRSFSRSHRDRRCSCRRRRLEVHRRRPDFRRISSRGRSYGRAWARCRRRRSVKSSRGDCPVGTSTRYRPSDILVCCGVGYCSTELCSLRSRPCQTWVEACSARARCYVHRQEVDRCRSRASARRSRDNCEVSGSRSRGRSRVKAGGADRPWRARTERPRGSRISGELLSCAQLNLSGRRGYGRDWRC